MTLETTKPKNVIAAVAAHYHTSPDNLCLFCKNFRQK